jgi:hypothetical protein
MKPMLEGSTPTSYWNENVLIQQFMKMILSNG